MLVMPAIMKAQKATIEEVEAALSLKLCEYVIWPEGSFDLFTIGVLTDDNSTYQAFTRLADNYMIAGHKIKIIRITSVSDEARLQMLYVGETRLDMIMQMRNALSEGNTLLITEKDTDTREIMFNLLPLPEEQRVTFEFNKTNIIFQGMDIRPEIIELRGSEIDVRDLYRQTKNRLEKVEKQISDLQKKTDEQNQTIALLGKSIDSLNSTIDGKNRFIAHQADSIEAQEGVLLKLTGNAQLLEEEIQKNRLTILSQKKDISDYSGTINDQNSQIAEQERNLLVLNKQILVKQNELSQKEISLSEKDLRIKSTTNLIYVFTVAFFIVALLVLLLLIELRKKRESKKILSEQKEELEATLNKLTQAQEQLVRAEKMASLGILTAGIAHEINNPVNFINSGSLGLQKILRSIIPLFEKYREYYVPTNENREIALLEEQLDIPKLLDSTDLMMNSIKTGIDRTVSIVKSLQIFARSGEEEIKAVNIHNNINLALTILYNQYKYSIEVIKNFGTLPDVYCYSGKMNQVFMNLLSNAIQAIPGKGTITITTRDIKPDIEISIKDTGVGIPQSVIGKIFDPFFTTKEEGKGTGMGLSIVYSIIEEHNGKISVTSKECEGTEFVITLPCRHGGE
jgi:signal transduction histidine kinase